MTNRYCFEALNRSLRDILSDEDLSNADRIFGGITVALGTGVIEDESFIEIPEDLKLSQHSNPKERIVNVALSNLSAEIGNVDYIKERAILIARNDTAHELNDYIIQKLQSETKTYHSSNSTCKAGGTSTDDDILHPIEFFNSLMCSSMPKHELQLKTRVPIMLLRNLNQLDAQWD
ncbi:uncharacterized protein LOC116129004 [Pistacia vera]|uniref:uncharacterized protein LOC116129004 n=1 Tax=Pistacia vera TaxID=55513 RepID=UPI0012637B7C|nr:uncharacterized protein LOC116129004 [Pistacia vera]